MLKSGISFVYKYSGRGLMYKQSLAEGLDIQEIIRIFML